MTFFKSERGATAAEYAIILAIFGSGMWAASEVLQRATTVALSNTQTAVAYYEITPVSDPGPDTEPGPDTDTDPDTDPGPDPEPGPEKDKGCKKNC